MKVLELNSMRFEAALELLREGKSFEFSNADFYLDKRNKIIEIRSITSWELQNLTEQRALEEIERGRIIFNYLIDESPKFAEIIKFYQPRFSLIHDNGTGAVEICYLSENKITWR